MSTNPPIDSIALFPFCEQDTELRFTRILHPRADQNFDHWLGTAETEHTTLDPLVMQAKQSVLQTGKSKTLEVERKLRGEMQVFQVRIKPIFDEGRVNGLATFSQDVTRLYRQQQELSTSREQFSGLLQNLPTAVLIIQEQHATVHWVNPAAEELLEVEYEDCLGEPVQHWFQINVEHLRAQLTQSSRVRFEAADVHTSSRRARKVLLQVSRIEYSSTPCLLFDCVDITEQFALQEQVRQHEETLRLVQEGARDGIWDWNWLTEEAVFSARFLELLGLSAKRRFSVNEWWERVHWEDRPALEECLQGFREGSCAADVFSLETRLRNRARQYRWFLMRGKVLRNPRTHKTERMVGTLTDIHDFRAAQDKAVQASKLELVGEATSSLAHELKTPLASIRLKAELLENLLPPQSPDKLKSKLQEIAHTVDEVTRDLGQLQKHMQQHFRHERTDCNLRELAQNAMALLQSRLQGQRILFKMQIPDRFPTVHANAAQLERMFLQLLTNACDALTEREDPEIVLTGSSEGGYAVMEVQDNGCGIPSENLNKIFQPFFSTKANGTGLGLAMVRRAAEEHSGRVECQSEEGAGSVFTIRLPTVT